MTDAPYTPSLDMVASRYAIGRDEADGRFDAEKTHAEFDRWLAAHDAEVRASVVPEEPEDDGEPCNAEIWSWDIFRHQEVDPYWMRCHLVGKHEKHENSETGATWPVEQGDE